MTFEEAARLDPDEQPGELDEGRWIPVTKSTWRHGVIMGKFTIVLGTYASTHREWQVACGDPGAKLRRDPDTLRGPDVAMIRVERVPTGKGAAGWLEGAPDLAVEIVGDAQSLSDVTKKALEYLAAGAHMVWVVDPWPERVVVFTPPSSVRVLGRDETLDGGDLLPGFACKVAELFE